MPALLQVFILHPRLETLKHFSLNWHLDSLDNICVAATLNFKTDRILDLGFSLIERLNREFVIAAYVRMLMSEEKGSYMRSLIARENSLCVFFG